MAILKALILPALLAGAALAVPTPAIEKRDLLSSVIAGLGADATDGAKILSAVVVAIDSVVPTTTPRSFPEATASLSSIFAEATNIVDAAPELILNGFDPKDIEDLVQGFSAADNSFNNSNTQKPSRIVYPKASAHDAPYSVSESSLRGAIHIPAGFTYGRKPPVILFPGTGAPAGQTFAYGYGRVLQNTTFADPLWVNIPSISLGDAQITAEYAAYALNYITAITKRNASIITFSQGSINVQWALKYWPSTRKHTTDFIALSPDYHGTVLAAAICPAFPNLGCAPGVLQQIDNSMFIKTLLADGGDSAYVPTTTVRSATDEIVQPQAGGNPTGFINDARHMGVSNTLVQDACPLTPAGTFVTHEGILYNALAYALAVDALTHKGPGQLSRVDTQTVCAMFAAQGQSLDDLLATEATAVTFTTNILLGEPRTLVEPPIMAYAAR